jgi:dTDP-4-dehydrorhamnose reductase
LKVLLIGAGGLLGARVFDEAMRRGFDVYAAYKTRPTEGKFLQLDITDKKAVFETIREVGPEVIINTAAFTDVDACEVEKETALKVNGEAVGYLAEASTQTGTYLLHVSTDYVFDGDKGMYREQDTPSPVNFYGYSKLLGEKIVKDLADDWCIVRTSALYGWGRESRPNFATWVINGLRSRRALKIVTDQYVSPTFNTELAGLLMEIAERKITGILHVAGAERATRYQMALKISEVFGLGKDLLQPVTSNSLNWKARRPKDSSLNIEKVTNKLGINTLNLTQALSQMREEELKRGL